MNFASTYEIDDIPCPAFTVLPTLTDPLQACSEHIPALHPSGNRLTAIHYT